MAWFIRFQTKMPDWQSGKPTGIFVIAHELRDSNRVSREEEEWLRSCLAWFKMHLKVPLCLREPANRRAVSWFKGDNRNAIVRVWDLVAFLKEHGIFVEMVRTQDPGIVVYEDGYQIVAKPRRERPNKLGAHHPQVRRQKSRMKLKRNNRRR